MKPSDLPKNSRISIRLNEAIKEIIQKNPNLSAQRIFDEWADKNIKLELSGPKSGETAPKKKRGPGRPPAKRGPGRPPGSKNKKKRA